MTSQNVTGGATQASATVLTRDPSGATLAVVSNPNGAKPWVRLPPGCHVDDSVEVYPLDNSLVDVNGNGTVLPPAGENFYGGVTVNSAPNLFRKIATGLWCQL